MQHAVLRGGVTEVTMVPHQPRTVDADTGQGADTAERRLRVMQVITHLDMGGAESVAMSLIDMLRARTDFSLFAVLQKPELSAVGSEMAARLAQWDVPVHFGVGGRFKSGGVVLAARRLVRELKRFRPDVVHLHTEIPELTFAVAALMSPSARTARVLRTVHNSSLWIDWGWIGRGVTTVLGRADAVAVSRHAAAADAAILTPGARPTCAVIYNGVAAPDRAAPQPPAAADAPFRLLFAGRLVHQKGADLLPAILAEAHRRAGRRDVEVTIAGSGALRDGVAQGLSGCCTGWTITMVPPIGGLAARLREYDAVLLPSRFEGFALLPLEVLMNGVPLITTTAPGLDEAIPADYPLAAPVDDVAGLAERLARVIDGTPEYRAVAAHFGAQLAARFSPANMAQGYADCYQRIAGAAARTA